MWHGFSWKFQFYFFFMSQIDGSLSSKSTPNSMTIPCNLSRFYCFPCWQYDMDFRQVQVMEFPWHLLRKWWDFPCGFGLIFEPNQTAVKMTWENPCHIFYRGNILSVYLKLIGMWHAVGWAKNFLCPFPVTSGGFFSDVIEVDGRARLVRVD